MCGLGILNNWSINFFMEEKNQKFVYLVAQSIVENRSILFDLNCNCCGTQTWVLVTVSQASLIPLPTSKKTQIITFKKPFLISLKKCQTEAMCISPDFLNAQNRNILYIPTLTHTCTVAFERNLSFLVEINLDITCEFSVLQQRAF